MTYSGRSLESSTDVVIVGAGFAGVAAAATLGRTCRVILIDPRPDCPAIFKAEKIEPEQADTLRRLDLLRPLLPFCGCARSVAIAARGRIVLSHAGEQFGLRYDAMVNALGGRLPPNVERRTERVVDIVPDVERSRVQLAGGEVIAAPLVVYAAGGGDQALLARLGVQREVITRDQSIAFGFPIEPFGGTRFPFESLTYYPFTVRAAPVGYLSLFPFRDHMRGNVFAFLQPTDPRVRAFLRDPAAELASLFPGLREVIGAYRVPGPVEFSRISLVRTVGHPRPGVLLIGDAVQNTCPSTGSGLSKALRDVELLSEYVPRWLKARCIGEDEIAAFSADPRKVSVDDHARRAAAYIRRLSVDHSLAWTMRRLKSQVAFRLEARRAGAGIGGHEALRSAPVAAWKRLARRFGGDAIEGGARVVAAGWRHKAGRPVGLR